MVISESPGFTSAKIQVEDIEEHYLCSQIMAIWNGKLKEGCFVSTVSEWCFMEELSKTQRELQAGK